MKHYTFIKQQQGCVEYPEVTVSQHSLPVQTQSKYLYCPQKMKERGCKPGIDKA